MPRRSRKNIAAILLTFWGIFLLALPVVAGLCDASHSKMATHDCCGAKIVCHQQIQPQPCCETQGKAPPAPSPLLSLASGLAILSVVSVADLHSSGLHPAVSVDDETSRAEIFLLKHSFLC